MVIKKIIDTLDLQTDIFLIEYTPKKVVIKEFRPINKTQEIDFDRLKINYDELANLKSQITSEFFIYKKNNSILVKKRKNNWFIQELYLTEKEGLDNFFSLYGFNIIDSKYAYQIVDVLDFIGDNSLLVGLYNYYKGKENIFEEIGSGGIDLSTIKAKYKKIITDYQDMLNNFQLIRMEGVFKQFDIQLHNGGYKTIVNDLPVEDLLVSDSFQNNTYNNLIFSRNFENIIKNLPEKIRNFFKEITVISIKDLYFIEEYYVVKIYKYKTDVEEFVKVYDNRTKLADLIEERQADKLKVDNILYNQFKYLKQSLTNG